MEFVNAVLAGLGILFLILVSRGIVIACKKRKLEGETPVENDSSKMEVVDIIIHSGATAQEVMQSISDSMNIIIQLKLYDDDDALIHLETLRPHGNMDNVMAATTVERAAAYLYSVAKYKRHDISLQKLHNLLYYAQGWYMLTADAPLFEEKFVACADGVKSDGLCLINYSPLEYDLPDDAKEILHYVVDNFGAFSDSALSGLVKKTRPWQEAIESDEGTVVSNKSLHVYFSEIRGQLSCISGSSSIH